MMVTTMLTVLKDATSFRGAAKNSIRWCNIFNTDSNVEIKTPSHSTIGRWVRRLGLFQLTRPLEKVDDMIAIVDASISVGKGKCVSVLGIPRHQYIKVQKENRALQFEDVQLLDQVVVESVTGEVVAEALKRSESRAGIIVQTCGDGGGEVVRGTRLFRSSVGEGRVVLHAYDVAHKLACILKAKIGNRQKWKNFITAAAKAKVKVQLGDAAHLAPPNQRSKSRYMNMEEFVTWGIKGLGLVKDHVKVMQEGLKQCEETYHKNIDADQPITSVSSMTISGNTLREAVDKPPLDIVNVSNFVWLLDHEEIIMEASRYLIVTGRVRHKLRIEGIHSQTYQEICNEFKDDIQDPLTQKLVQDILKYIKEHASGLQPGDVLCVTSEILESLYGKMKYLMDDDLKHGLTSQVLSLGACLGKLDEEIVKNAMEQVSDKQVKEWTQKNIGQTYTQKRRQYLGSKNKKPGRKHGQKLSGNNRRESLAA